MPRSEFLSRLKRALALVVPLLWLLPGVLILSACGAKKTVQVTAEPLRDKSPGYLLKRYERNAFVYDWVGMKMDAELKTLGETQEFKATVRMKRDSVVWISLSPALGIEMLRVLITPDSVRYVSKIPENKYYYEGNFEVVNELIKTNIDFDMLQDILVGNAIGLEKDEGKFRSEIDDDKYLLTSRYRRKVKMAVGVDDRRMEDVDTIAYNPADRRYQRAVEKVDEEDLVISRYWLDGQYCRLVKCVFNDLLNKRTIEIEYSEFAESEGQFYPSRGTLRILDWHQISELNFKIDRIAVGKPYELEYEIPEGFDRRSNP
jgi:hypothetical protein